MKRFTALLFAVAASALLMGAAASFAEDRAAGAPPVSQPLIREGEFALKLAAALELGKPGNEAEAEGRLAATGVAPKNGWISDFPVTPDILNELAASVQTAAANGRLALGKKEAVGRLYSLSREVGLPVVVAAEKGYVTGEEYSLAQGYDEEPSVINNYYYDEGPPVVTYYPPPPEYVYLYDWDPFPFWWGGFWFPGFFCLHTFTTVVVANGGTVIISNSVIDPVSGKTVFVDPVTRAFTSASFGGAGHADAHPHAASAFLGGKAAFSSSVGARDILSHSAGTHVWGMNSGASPKGAGPHGQSGNAWHGSSGAFSGGGKGWGGHAPSASSGHTAAAPHSSWGGPVQSSGSSGWGSGRSSGKSLGGPFGGGRSFGGGCRGGRC